MKCDNCQFLKIYRTGSDEYPAYTTLVYCGTGHWDNGDPSTFEDNNVWDNCEDFKEESKNGEEMCRNFG